MTCGSRNAYVAAALGMVLTWASPRAPAEPPAGSAARGKQLYVAHGCYGCHGYNGETGARDLVGTGSPIVADEKVFIAFLRMRADQAPHLPSTRMPNYPAAALSDAAARDIFAFVRTLKLDAPAVESVPAMRKILESAARPRP